MAERLIHLAGAASHRGDGARLLSGLLHYLAAQAGIDDVAEGSYRVDDSGRALAYDQVDTRRGIDAAVRAAEANLGWHRRELGVGGRLHLLGWSLGGAVLFEAAGRLVAHDAAWRGAFGAIVTLSSPINGCDVDGYTDLGAIAAGDTGRELCLRAADPAHRTAVAAAAALLRETGARLLTLGAENDVIVTPKDSIVLAAGETRERYVMRPPPRLGSDFGEQRLGHGAILHDPKVWRLVLEAVLG